MQGEAAWVPKARTHDRHQRTGFVLGIGDVLLQEQPELAVGVQQQELETLLSNCLGFCNHIYMVGWAYC